MVSLRHAPDSVSIAGACSPTEADNTLPTCAFASMRQITLRCLGTSASLQLKSAHQSETSCRVVEPEADGAWATTMASATRSLTMVTTNSLDSTTTGWMSALAMNRGFLASSEIEMAVDTHNWHPAPATLDFAAATITYCDDSNTVSLGHLPSCTPTRCSDASLAPLRR
eukprot:1576739-Alexandrium_andersonii.AAC.1